MDLFIPLSPSSLTYLPFVHTLQKERYLWVGTPAEKKEQKTKEDKTEEEKKREGERTVVRVTLREDMYVGGYEGE
jgi:hypothetical protein